MLMRFLMCYHDSWCVVTKAGVLSRRLVCCHDGLQRWTGVVSPSRRDESDCVRDGTTRTANAQHAARGINENDSCRHTPEHMTGNLNGTPRHTSNTFKENELGLRGAR